MAWQFVMYVKPTATWGEVVAVTNGLQNAYNADVAIDSGLIKIKKINDINVTEFVTNIDDDAINRIEFVTKEDPKD